MSHRATNWAILQRGLMPATKLVLWHLCNRHNPENGCFPSQDQLAADTEISRASLNTHLRKLIEAGLIRRQRRADPGSNQRKSTCYVLGFEEDFQAEPCPDLDQNHAKPCPDLERNEAEPCPDSGQNHVQNLDTNLVIETVTTTTRDASASGGFEAACFEVCGPGLTETSRVEISATRSVIVGWLAAGYDLDADILPTLADRTGRKRASPIRTWDYFTPAIAQRHARRLANDATDQRAGEAGAVATVSASDADPLARLAAWINSSKYIPPSAVSTSQRNALLAAGLVTVAALRARQIY